MVVKKVNNLTVMWEFLGWIFKINRKQIELTFGLIVVEMEVIGSPQALVQYA